MFFVGSRRLLAFAGLAIWRIVAVAGVSISLFISNIEDNSKLIWYYYGTFNPPVNCFRLSLIQTSWMESKRSHHEGPSSKRLSSLYWFLQCHAISQPTSRNHSGLFLCYSRECKKNSEQGDNGKENSEQDDNGKDMLNDYKSSHSELATINSRQWLAA